MDCTKCGSSMLKIGNTYKCLNKNCGAKFVLNMVNGEQKLVIKDPGKLNKTENTEVKQKKKDEE